MSLPTNNLESRRTERRFYEEIVAGITTLNYIVFKTQRRQRKKETLPKTGF